MYHPLYPNAANLAREAAASDRDVADLATLRELRQLVADAFATASRSDEIRHPDRRWMVADLLDTLQDQLADITDTIALVQRGPLCTRGRMMRIATDIMAATLAASHGLTPAETRLLEAFLQGERVCDYADRTGVSLNTVQTHLKRIFEKTGTGRQAELMRHAFVHYQPAN